LRVATRLRCPCCSLQETVQYGDEHATLTMCMRCREHDGDTIADLAAREIDHAAMYHRALLDAQDEALLAQGERDHYRVKMQAAYASRELLVEVLSEVAHQHHPRGKRCSCGKRRCPMLTRLADPRVARLVRTYDEAQRTMRELHAANPDRWVDKWDYIDVSLVYPEPAHSSRGRHRATG
jgi:hypothetical protein